MQRVILLVALAVFTGACSKAPVPVVRTAERAADVTAGRCAFCPEPSPPDCILCAASNPLLTVDKDGATSATLRLCNRGDTPQTIDLSLSDFHAVDARGTAYPLAAVRTLSGVSTADNPILAGTSQLGPSACVGVKVDGAKIWQAGLSVADLQNGPTKLLQLKAIRYQVPFNVKVEGATPEIVNVLFTRGKQSLIRLRNEDELTYRVLWRFELGDVAHGGETVIAGHGAAALPVNLDEDDYALLESGIFRSAARSGTLTLAYEPAAGFGMLPLPHRRYPVSARLSYFVDARQRTLNYVAILFVLLLGIAISFLVNQVLPAQKKRVDIKQRLADLEGRLAGFGAVVDTRLLNLLRVEKKRFREELRSFLSIFPQTTVELPKLELRIDSLVRRIELTARAGELLAAVDGEPGRLAVPESRAIRAHCHEVLEVVRKPMPTADEIQAAQRHLDLSAAILRGAENPPTEEAVKALQDQADELKSKIPNPLPADSAWTVCEELLNAFVKDLPTAGHEERREYVRKAEVVRRLELLLEYIETVESSPGTTVRAARLKRAEDLFSALRPGPDASIANADDIVRQVEQNVTKKNLVDAMTTAGAMHIEIDPPTPVAYQLVTFRVRFERPGLDSAVAQNEIDCRWYVGGNLVDDRAESDSGRVHQTHGGGCGRGWIVGTYLVEKPRKWRHLPRLGWNWLRTTIFRWPPSGDGGAVPRLGPFKVEATFPELSGLQVPASVTIERTRSYVESRSMLALASLAITVLIVAIGLLTGAQERLQSLDWLSGALAVLALGFGADTVKTLIART